MAPTTRRSRTSPSVTVDPQTTTVSEQDPSPTLTQITDSSISTPLLPPAVSLSEVVKRESSSCSTSTGRTRKEFCVICQCYINKGGKKNDSPRRHILKNHWKKALFSCSICGHSSLYDKAHVNIHIRNVHKGAGEAVATPKAEYINDLQEWMGRCFPGEITASQSTPSSSAELRGEEAEQLLDESVERKSPTESLPADPTPTRFQEVKEEPVDVAYEQSLSPTSLSSQQSVSFIRTREALLQMAALQYEQAVLMINSLFPLPQ